MNLTLFGVSFLLLFEFLSRSCRTECVVCVFYAVLDYSNGLCWGLSGILTPDDVPLPIIVDYRDKSRWHYSSYHILPKAQRNFGCHATLQDLIITRRAYYHMQACGNNVLLCTGGKITTKSMAFFNRKEVNYVELMYVVLVTQILFFFFFADKCILHSQVLKEWGLGGSIYLSIA